MATALPKEIAIEQYNELLRMPFSAQEDIRMKSWRLRSAQKTNPTDPVINATLLLSYFMSGEAESANTQADYMYGFRDSFDQSIASIYAQLLVELGRYERCQSYVKELANQSDKPLDALFFPTLIHSVWASGRLKQDLPDFVSSPEGDESSTSEYMPLFLERLESANLVSAFEAYMKSVNSVLDGYQCGITTALRRYEEGPPELVVESYTNEPRARRRELENRIDAAVADNPIETMGASDPIITVCVHDIRAHPPLDVR